MESVLPTDKNTTGIRLLVAESDPHTRRILRRWLEHAGHEVVEARDARAAHDLVARDSVDMILLSLEVAGLDELNTREMALLQGGTTPWIALSSDASPAVVVTTMRNGASDYIVKPLTRTRIAQAVEEAAPTLVPSPSTNRECESVQIVGNSDVMSQLKERIDLLARVDAPVLIRGESGTGKELAARMLHDNGPRSNGPFVAINCAALPEGIIESELFGHEEGAFTGAIRKRIGRFEQAHGGTIFLDEVGELSPALQAKLLRVIQERRFHRVGGTEEIQTDVRILTATHQDLESACTMNRFREDLYYRIAVVELDLPALRERAGDVTLLVQHFARQIANTLRRSVPQFAERTLDVLEHHHWPGNVRELRNAVERALVLCPEGSHVNPDHLPPRMLKQTATPRVTETINPAPNAQGIGTIDQMERTAIEAALARTGGNVSEVGRALGMSRTTLYRRLKEYGLR